MIVTKTEDVRVSVSSDEIVNKTIQVIRTVHSLQGERWISDDGKWVMEYGVTRYPVKVREATLQDIEAARVIDYLQDIKKAQV